MAEPLPRAGRPRRATRVLMLVSAIVAIVASCLFMSPAANAAPAATAATASTAATSGTAATAEPAGQTATAHTTAVFRPAATICNIPGVGDIGGLLNLCQSGSGIVGDLNNVCQSNAPTPELATAGIDSMITTPGGQTTGKTLYDNYGMAGLNWASYGLNCSQLTSSIGNNVAGMVFDVAKSLDRVTITVYQSASSNSLLNWLSSSVNQLIKSLGNAVYFPFLAPMVIIGVIWLAWQGLVRKRATRTFEGTIWMVVACVAALWLIGQPNDFTNVGSGVSNGVTTVLNDAFSQLPAAANSNCLPVANTDPQSVSASYAFTSGNDLVDQNANELWSVLVCKPWLDGELGTTQFVPLNSPQAGSNLVNQYGRQLLFAQAVALNEKPTTQVVDGKESVYNGIAATLKANNPAVYSLFQGDQWTTRLEIGFEALFAAVAAGLLILLIALTLIILKLGFLLLLVAGPFFLIIGIHPGFGRVVAIRWFEMLIGVLLKQVAVALTLSVLLYCYALIMGQSDQALPWALKILMIALVTVAVFIYRKPFQHLFSSVGYGMLGAEERAQVSLRQSTFGFRRVTSTAAGVMAPNVGAARAARWARRGPSDAAAAAAAGAAPDGSVPAPGAGGPDGSTGGTAPESQTATRQWPGAGVGAGGGRAAPPLPLPTSGGGGSHGRQPSTGAPSAGWARGDDTGTGSGSRATAQPPARGAAPSPVRQGPAPQSTPAAAPAPARSAPTARHTPPPARQTPAPARQAPPPPVRQAPPPAQPGAARQQSPAPGARPATGSRWPSGATPLRSGDSSTGPAAQPPKPAAAPFWSRSRRRSR